MDMAKFLKDSANLVIGAAIIRLVAGDLAAEVRKDLGTLRRQSNAMVSRSPYRVAGAATVMGILAGMMLAKHRHGRT
jgi:ElaB/YqjD/DUF883 family membrane-anchored ribosome-binding protein